MGSKQTADRRDVERKKGQKVKEFGIISKISFTTNLIGMLQIFDSFNAQKTSEEKFNIGLNLLVLEFVLKR